MSPSPFSVSSPTDPASYSWEATDEGVAERFGIPISQVLRFDLNTSPAPPALLAGLLAAGRFETPLSEYPPGDYRRLVEAAADAYGVSTDELVPGAGADEILDMCTKAFLPAGEAAVSRIRNAGAIFVGRWSPESAGDYASGANHVLPTGGLARACGPLAVETYGKFSQVQRITREGLAALRPTIRTLAEAEGLLAHRDAVEARFPDDDPAREPAR